MEHIFDDTYTGPRFKYGCTYRPPFNGGAPDGMIIFADKKHPDFDYGTIEYPFELTAEQISRYELIPVPEALP